MKPPHLIEIPQGQSQMAQNRKAPQLCQSQGFLQIIPQGFLGLGSSGGHIVIQVRTAVLPGQQVHRADDEIKLRRVLQQLFHVGRGLLRVAHLHAQPQMDAVPQRGLNVSKIRCQPRPVIGRAQFIGPPGQGLHMIRKADLVHPGIQCGLGHHRHGIMSIGRKLRMGMVICQIHTLPHFLNFLKNFFRSS